MAQTYTRRINLWINGKQVQNDIKSIRAAMLHLQNRIATMTRGTAEYNKTASQIRHLRGILSQHNAQLRATRSVWERLGRFVSRYRIMFMSLFASIAGGGLSIRRATQDFQEFEKSLAGLNAIMDVGAEQMDFLKIKAKELSTSVTDSGVRLTQSASEILDAFGKIGHQLPALLQDPAALVETTTQAMYLAAAGGITLEQAATALAGSLNQMELGADQAGRVINVLGAGSRSGAANIEYLNRVVERTGSTARAIGIPFEELIGIIEGIAPRFTRADEASTQLRNVLLLLASGADHLNPQIVGLQKALENLAKEELSLAEIRERFGRANVSMVLALIENRDQIEKYTEAVTGSNVAVEQAVINTSTQQAKLKQARNELNLVSVALGQRLSPALTGGIQGLAEFLKFLMLVIEHTWRFRSILITATSGIVAYTIAVKGAAAVKAIYATTVKAATAVQKGFNLAMKKNPIGLIAAGITMLVVGLAQYSRKLREAKTEVEALSEAESIRNQIREDAQKLTAKDISSLDVLYQRLKATNKEGKERSSLINQLNRDYSQYLSNLLSEEASLQQIKAAYDQISTAIRQKIEIQVKEDAAKKLFEEIFALEQELKTLAQKQRPAILRQLFGDDWTWEMVFPDLTGEIAEKRELYDQLISEIFAEPFKPKVSVDPELDDDPGKRYSLSGDQQFQGKLLQLKEQFLSGVIATEQEYQNQLLALEIQFLEARLALGVDSGENLLALQHQLTDRRLQAHKTEQQRISDLHEGIETPAEREKREFDERLVALGLFGRSRESLTAIELENLIRLEREHQANLDAIDAEAMKNELERRQASFELALTEMQVHHQRELNGVQTFRQALAKLREFMSDDELSKIKTYEQAKAALKQEHQRREENFTKQHLTALIAEMESILDSGQWDAILQADDIFSDAEKKILLERLQEAYAGLQKLRGGGDDEGTAFTPHALGGLHFDILGFTQNDWQQFFENLENGVVGIQEVQFAVRALGNVWADVNRLIANSEAQKLEEYKQNRDAELEALQERLNAGLISTEAFNYQRGKLEDDFDRKKAQIALDQARREKNVAYMNVVVNTAAAVMKAFSQLGPIAGAIMAGIVTAAGAAQLAIIRSTPLPTIPGAETGGFIEVVRQQDGKPFKAKHDPNRRGWVHRPTVLTGEAGSEYVIPREGVENPSVRRIINTLEMARINGNLPSLDLDGVQRFVAPGRQRGGQLATGSTTLPGADQAGGGTEWAGELLKTQQQLSGTINELKVIQERLEKNLREPIKAEVALTGRKGLHEAEEKFRQIKRNVYI